jgi:hypothetical protein
MSARVVQGGLGDEDFEHACLVRGPLSEIGAYGVRDRLFVFAQDILQEVQPAAAFPKIREVIPLKCGLLPAQNLIRIDLFSAGCSRYI